MQPGGGWGLLATPLSTLFPPASASETAGPDAASHGGSAATAGSHAAAPPGPAPDGGANAAGSADIPAIPAPPLYRDVRELQRLQDRMATGSGEALAAQNALIASIDRDLRAADSLAWRDPLNARALVIFALSGGGPATLRAVLGKGANPDIDERLVRGSLAYLEGREADALKELGEVDARALPASLAGQVALAQAALWVRRDPARAAALLGYARLIAPGTLVEEAALRREIFIAAQANDLSGFERLSSAYLARFRHSVYAGNFRQRFAAALTRMDFLNDANEFHRLDDLLAPIEPEGRREIALMVAQAAVAQGRTTAATMAAARVLAAAPPGSLDADRARLYRAAAMAASADRFDVAEAELQGIARERLSSADGRLLDAARSVAGAVEHASDGAPAPVSTAKAESSSNPSGDTEPDPPPAILAKAQAALHRADDVLAGGPL
ncbi:chemotaxis protein MotC [Starkeya koreensis]|uniref:Chemotaxis protein MotC n=1 Tax=Ancylobacter koreensis TaxID=266121 RepID=A0ABT0DKT5_9HYPH|nr:chemotaxis protein MotC [Ancylobacter koreensis]MCK0207896.1 chemotaxis protein MotC [Ancylobacter koreensis]